MNTNTDQNQAVRQALAEGVASAQLEGYIPTRNFQQDCGAIIEGSLTFEQARANALARAQRDELA